MAGSRRTSGPSSTRSGGSTSRKTPRRPSGRGTTPRPRSGGTDVVGGSARRLPRLSLSLGTRRAAVLAIVVGALALALAVPLRTYVSQRQELAATATTQAQLTAEVSRLQAQKDQLADPSYVEAQARGRLGFVRPGETPYRVQLPDSVARSADPQQQAAAPAAPWYSTLWGTVSGSGG